MKKIAILLCVLSLTGCVRISDLENKSKKHVDENKEVSVECVKNEETILLQADGDRVNQMEQTFFCDLKDLGINEKKIKKQDKKKIAEAVDKIVQKKYGNLDGVTVKSELKKERVCLVVEINYRKANFKELEKAGFLNSSDRNTDEQYLSLKLTKKDFEGQGYACSVE